MIVIELVRFFFEIILTLCATGLVLVGGSFLVLVGINILELVSGGHWRVPLPPAQLAVGELPHVLVQIPVFNEPEMVADALMAAAALDWPKDRLHIQLLDDSTDDTPAIADIVIKQFRADGFDIDHVRRENRTGFKAGALGVGLSMSDAPFIAMLDVDFRPPRNWLRTTVPYLVGDPKAGFLQSRCEFSNYKTNWLTRAQGMLLDAHFAMEQATRYRAGWLFQFNGTGGIWRRAAIVSGGGWSAESLCEDLDLTVRTGLAGWHGIFLMEPAVPGLRARPRPPLAGSAEALVQRLRASRAQIDSTRLVRGLAALAQSIGDGIDHDLSGLPLRCDRPHRALVLPHSERPQSARLSAASRHHPRSHRHGFRRHDAFSLCRLAARQFRGICEDARLTAAVDNLRQRIECAFDLEDFVWASRTLQTYAEDKGDDTGLR